MARAGRMPSYHGGLPRTGRGDWKWHTASQGRHARQDKVCPWPRVRAPESLVVCWGSSQAKPHPASGLAGIIHDIGKLLFIEFLPKEYEKVLKLVKEKNCFIKDAEVEILGMDHCRAGQILAEKWKLPSGLQDAILLHHVGIKANQKSKMVASVHIADILTTALELGKSGDNIIPEPNFKVWEIIKSTERIFSFH